MEPLFNGLDGVIKIIPGYTGGHLRDPSYKEVSSGKTGHMEAVKIIYDPEKITYTQLIARIHNS